MNQNAFRYATPLPGALFLMGICDSISIQEADMVK